MLVHDLVGPLVYPMFLVTDFEWTVTDESQALKYVCSGDPVPFTYSSERNPIHYRQQYRVTASYTLQTNVIDIVGRTLEAESVERLISSGHWDENYGLYDPSQHRNCWKVTNHEAVGTIHLRGQILSFDSCGLALRNQRINLADPDSGIEQFIDSLQAIVRQRRRIICSNTKDLLILNA